MFDPDRILLSRAARVLLSDSRPDDENRQGNDIGASYPSVIYYVDASGLWPGMVVTEVEPAGPFWEAEPEQQDYLERYPSHFIRPGWKLPRRV
jgi:peptide-methionine (S)-S-oxide reductase